MTVALIMESEFDKWKIETPLPSALKRFAWWFGIYCAGVLVIPILLSLVTTRNNPLTFLLSVAGFIFIFPCGLGGLIGGLFAGVAAILPHAHSLSSEPATLNAPLVIVVLFACYGTFITHLVYTLKAKTHLAIRRLLLGLAPLLVLDLVGWYILLITSNWRD